MPRLKQRLGKVLRWRTSALPEGPSEQVQATLQSAGLLLRQARESQQLGLRQLAQETRISTPVLEALERGWRDRLPEAAYLRTMLQLLEQRLQLAPGSLDGALPLSQSLSRSGHRSEKLLLRFTPGSIDVFTTWQGTLLYGLLTLGLIYGLNLQLRQISRQGLLSSSPLPPVASGSDTANPRPQLSRLLKAYPELTPLKRAGQGQALGRLRSESLLAQVDMSLGKLSLQLDVPTRVELHSEAGGTTTLNQVSGALSLPVLPPFKLQLQPEPTGASAVLWNGRPLKGGAAQAGLGSYVYPTPRP